MVNKYCMHTLMELFAAGAPHRPLNNPDIPTQFPLVKFSSTQPNSIRFPDGQKFFSTVEI